MVFGEREERGTGRCWCRGVLGGDFYRKPFRRACGRGGGVIFYLIMLFYTALLGERVGLSSGLVGLRPDTTRCVAI